MKQFSGPRLHAAADATAGKATGHAGKWSALSLIGMSSVVIVLNNSSVSLSISALVRDLGSSVSAIQAVLSLYALVTAVCMLPGAKLADRFGAKRMFPLGALLYGCGALVVAAAQNSAMLLVGMSLVQGVAAGVMMPTALSLLSAAYPGEKRAGALAAYSAVASVSMAVGPLMAGAITTYLTWRLVFLLEGVLVAVLLLRRRALDAIPAPAPDRTAKFDAIGALLSMAALFCIIVGALLAKTYGWARALRPFAIGGLTFGAVSPTAILLPAGIVLLALLVAWLARAKRHGRAALVDISLFKNRGFSFALLVKMLAQMAVTGILFAVPVYLQDVLQYSALATGVSLLPLPLMLLAAALLVVRLSQKIGRKAVVVSGAVLLVAGAGVMWLVFARFGGQVTGPRLLPAVALLGGGMGCIMSPANTLALSGVAPKLANQGSGTLTTANNLASSLGTAITGSLLLGGVRAALESALQANYPAVFGGYSRDDLARMLAAVADKMQAAAPALQNMDAAAQSSLKDTLLAALNTSMGQMMLVMAAFAVLAALAALLGLPGQGRAARRALPQKDVLK